MPALSVRVALWVSPALVAATPLTAQFRVYPPSIRFTVSSDNVWRGLTRSNRTTAFPEAALTTQLAVFYVTGTVWVSHTWGRARITDLSDKGPGEGGIGERMLSADIAVPAGPATVSAGIAGYHFYGTIPGSRTSAEDTKEIFGRVNVALAGFHPTIKAFYDFEKVKGWYLEGGGAAAPWRLGLPSVVLQPEIGFVAGYSADQDATAATPGELARYARRGGTHGEFWGGVSARLRSEFPLVVRAALHHTRNWDPATQRRSNDPADPGHRSAWHFNIAAQIAGPFVPQRRKQ